MTYIKVQHLHIIKKPDGRVLYYHRKTRERLSDDPRVAREQCVAITAKWRGDAKIPVGGAGSMHDLIFQYQASTEFSSLSEQTKRSYRAVLQWIDDNIGKFAASKVKREAILKLQEIRSQEGKRRTADLTVAVLSNLFRYAIDRPSVFNVVVNPALKVRKAAKAVGHKPWPPALIETFRKGDADLWRVVSFILNTGMRRGNAITARWDDWNGAVVYLKPSKNGAEVWIPFKPEYRLEFEQYPVRGEFILAPSYAAQWHEATLSHAIADAVKDYGFDGFSLHGLRYNACQNLAEAGCTPHEIMSITGHKTVQMVEGYTRHFERKKSAVEAVRKLEGPKESVSKNPESVNAPDGT